MKWRQWRAGEVNARSTTTSGNAKGPRDAGAALREALVHVVLEVLQRVAPLAAVRDGDGRAGDDRRGRGRPGDERLNEGLLGRPPRREGVLRKFCARTTELHNTHLQYRGARARVGVLVEQPAEPYAEISAPALRRAERGWRVGDDAEHGSDLRRGGRPEEVEGPSSGAAEATS